MSRVFERTRVERFEEDYISGEGLHISMYPARTWKSLQISATQIPQVSISTG